MENLYVDHYRKIYGLRRKIIKNGFGCSLGFLLGVPIDFPELAAVTVGDAQIGRQRRRRCRFTNLIVVGN